MRFGAHCSGGVKKALGKAVEMDADAVQLFVQSPRTWRFPDHDPDDLQNFRDRREEAGLPAFVHALYLVNLAAPDEQIHAKSVETMRATLDAACAIDADGVVFHVGSHLGAGLDAGIERVVPALAQILDRTNDRTWLLMENSAGAGGTIGRSVDELAVLFDALERHRASRHLPRLMPPLRLRNRRHGPGDDGNAPRRARPTHRARPPSRLARERREGATRLEP